MKKNDKKVMIIVWKWKNNKAINNLRMTKSQEMDEINVYSKEGNDTQKFIVRIKDSISSVEIKKFINKYNDIKNKLILIHEGDRVGYNIEEAKGFLKQSYGFTGNKKEVTNLYDNLIDDDGEFEKSAIYRDKNNNPLGIKESIFNLIWTFYISEDGKLSPAQRKEKKEIREKSRHILKNLLPLSIDIQGLSEVKGIVRSSYIKDICISSIKSTPDYYKELLVDFWNIMFEQKFKINKGKLEKAKGRKNADSMQTIIKNTELDFNNLFWSNHEIKFDLGLRENIKEINHDSPLVKFMIKMDEVCYQNDEEMDDLYKKFISESEREFFFPQWLEELTKKIDEIEKRIN